MSAAVCRGCVVSGGNAAMLWTVDHRPSMYIYTVSIRKKGATIFLLLTLPNADRSIFKILLPTDLAVNL